MLTKKKFVYSALVAVLAAYGIFMATKPKAAVPNSAVVTSQSSSIGSEIGSTVQNNDAKIQADNSIAINNTPPDNIKSAQDELNTLDKQLKDQNIIARLNAGNVDPDQRKQYMAMFKRMDMLSNYITTERYKALSIKVSEVKKEQAIKLQQLGITPKS